MDSNATQAPPGNAPSQRPVVMFVDDEANILSAMRRLFRSLPFEITTAASGADALAQLEQRAVDVIVSDMRMPQQSGAELLCIVKQRWPQTMRIILTGYADVSDTLQAINSGEIYRYVLKPWNDTEFTAVVQDALEVKNIRDERVRLEALVRQQNRDLAELNTSLEQKVEARTAELQRTLQMLSTANESLKRNFLTSIKVFTALIEMRAGALAGHSRRVADLARQIAKKHGLSDVDAQEVMVAGLLHDIGKLVLPDKLIQTSYALLSPSERQEYEKHTLNGQAALMSLEQLQKPALLIRHHHERFDGKGYPDGLAGKQIPVGARILAVANDFDSLQGGMLDEQALSRDDAIKAIQSQAGKRYDPDIVVAFGSLVDTTPVTPARVEISIKSAALKAGMVLARDLHAHSGLLLLAADHTLDERLIEQIHQFERAGRQPLAIYIYKPTEPAPQAASDDKTPRSNDVPDPGGR